MGNEPTAINAIGMINGRKALNDETVVTDGALCDVGNDDVMVDPNLFESRYETKATGMVPSRPMRITVPRFPETPRLAAAAKGPGVGGTSVCVVYNPVDNASESCVEF